MKGREFGMSEVTQLSMELADRLGQIEGVAAVTLGGSHATGEADADSDVDLGIYYRHEAPPDIEALRSLAREFDDRGQEASVTRIGEWGPWINGGAWLVVDGTRVDWLYRDLSDVQLAISSARSGLISSHYQPGHPHAFHNYIYAAEVHYGKPLKDPSGILASLKKQTAPYPPKLKDAITRKSLWEARFSLETARKSARRGDVTYVAGCVFRTAMCLAQVLFAANERYWINEKRAVSTAGSLPFTTPGFSSAVAGCWTGLGPDPEILLLRLEALERTVAEVERLVTSPQ